MPLPDFLIIGSMKSATTSLYNYLNLHPQISMPVTKSLNFFNDENYLNGTWHKGIEWNESQFPDDTKVNGEASTGYNKYPFAKDVTDRIRYTIPNVKLIYIIRDPVCRAISHYLHNVIRGHEVNSIKDSILKDENNHYINCSRYHFQLQLFLHHFNLSQVLVITTEALGLNARDTIQRIFRFLDVDHSFFIFDYYRRHNTLSQNITRMRTKGNYAFPYHLNLLLDEGTTIMAQKAQLVQQYIPFRLETMLGFHQDHIEVLVKHLSDDVHNLRRLLSCEFQEWKYGYCRKQ